MCVARSHGGDDRVAPVARTFCLRRWQMSRLAASTSVSPTPAAHAIAIIAVSSIGRPAPAGAWGEDGGRVYSTAILTLTMQANYRYTPLVR